MFSAILLHWNLHAPLPDSQRLTLNEWIELNRGIAGSVGNLPDEVLTPLYHILQNEEHMNLQIDSPEQARGAKAGESAVTEFAQIEGWVRVLGSQVRVPKGLSSNDVGSVSCVQMSSMLSEATDTARRQREPSSATACLTPTPRQTMTGDSTGMDAAGLVTLTPFAGPPQDTPDAAWLSLCGSMLFFSVSPGDGAPFAFIHLCSVRLLGLEPGKSSITIDGGNAGFTAGNNIPLQMVFLLPDGRWQNFEIPELEIEICDRSLLEFWMHHLTELCKTAPSVPDGDQGQPPAKSSDSAAQERLAEL
jgi:hypothetical protein